MRVLPMPSFDEPSSSSTSPSSSSPSPSPSPSPSSSTSSSSTSSSSSTLSTSSTSSTSSVPRWSAALWAGFSAGVKQRMAVMQSVTPAPILSRHVVDAISLVEDAREPAGMVRLQATLDADDHDWPLLCLARVDNLAGNAHASNNMARSLALHQRALARYRAGQGSVDDVAYSLAQCTRRLVNLKRNDEAAGLVAELRALSVSEPRIVSNAWVRNRFFEATLLCAHAWSTSAPSRALALVRSALDVADGPPVRAPTAYTHEATIDLWSLLASLERVGGNLDAGLAACARVRDDLLARPPAQRTENYVRYACWAMCEGAYVARRLERPSEALPFLDALRLLGTLTPERAAYAGVLRGWANMMLGEYDAAGVALDEAGATSPANTLPAWVASALQVTRAELAAVRGDVDRARALAADVTARFPDEADDCARAEALLTRLAR